MMVNQGSTFNSARASKAKPNNVLNDARNHQRSEPPKVNTLSQFVPGGHKTLHVGHILEAHNDNSKNAFSSVSKISLLANKIDKIKMYNQEARVVQK